MLTLSLLSCLPSNQSRLAALTGVVCVLSMSACDGNTTKPAVRSTADVTTVKAPVVAMSVDGLVSVAYEEDITRSNVYVADYGEDGSFVERTRLSERIIGPKSNIPPVVARDASGWAIVSWNSETRVVASTFNPGTGMWSKPDSISGGIGRPAVAMDGSGRGWLIWSASDGMRASCFVPGGGWQGVVIVDSDAGNTPRIAAQLGVATAVWFSSGAKRIRSSRYDPAGGWSAPELVATIAATGGPEFDLAMNRSAANTMAAVVHSRGDSLFINRYIPGSGWAGDINGDAADISNPVCAMEPSGVVTAVYERAGRLAIRRYDPGFGWGSLTLHGDATAFDGSIDVAAGADGFAVGAWEDSQQIMVTALTPTSGWSPTTVVSTQLVSGTTVGVAASSGAGTAMVVWVEASTTTGTRVGMHWIPAP